MNKFVLEPVSSLIKDWVVRDVEDPDNIVTFTSSHVDRYNGGTSMFIYHAVRLQISSQIVLAFDLSKL